MRMRARNIRTRWLLTLAIVSACGATQAGPPKKKVKATWHDRQVSAGKRLFLRSWVPGDPRARGGDGLGPVFNARSCVACHGLAGPGGGGANETNVELLSALPTARAIPGQPKPKAPHRAPIVAIHPAFADSGSIVLHRFGLAPVYQTWRAAAPHALDTPRPPVPTITPAGWAGMGRGPGRDDPGAGKQSTPAPEFRLVVSRRNAPALFGAGRIDAIPESALEAEARRQAETPVKGRVSRLKDGRAGRFGWKAQVPSLDDFVLTACANELGLEVPGHHQAADPFGYGSRQRPGLDMSADDARALVAYVGALPAPRGGGVAAGRILFDDIGCADCHKPDLGGVIGLYSDLLLHDMGPSLSDSGMYYGPEEESSPGVPKSPEWRTPPLWGVADSAPYLHDGRARSLSEAISSHGGQAQTSAQKFASLTTTEKADLLGFLRSLKAPGPGRISNHDRGVAIEEFLPFTPEPPRPPVSARAPAARSMGMAGISGMFSIN